MNYMTEHSKDPCDAFLDQLDMWLAGEVEPGQSLLMQAHHDACAACRQEALLARDINSIVAALPIQHCPELHLAGIKHGQSRAEPGLVSRLLATWRQPLVLIPAFALLMVTLLFQLRFADKASEPETIVINGREFSREEIMQAAADLELALRYLDKYGSYPARVVQSELEQSHLPLPAPQERSNTPVI